MEWRPADGGGPMRKTALVLLFSGCFVLAGCKEHPRGTTTAPATAPPHKPVVAMAPVPTKPFEDGYEAGYDLGKKDARPRAKIPEPEDVGAVARQQSAGHP